MSKPPIRLWHKLWKSLWVKCVMWRASDQACSERMGLGALRLGAC